MKTFDYQARDSIGHDHVGSIDAVDVDEARQSLRKSGYHVLVVKENDDPPDLIAPLVSRSDVIYLTTQLAVMVDTGISLSTALESIEEQTENSTLRRVLTEVRTTVEGGGEFSRALERHPKLFDKTDVSLIRSSEATGTLPETLDRIAEYLRKELENKQKVRAAMAYPTVMIVLTIVVTIFLLTFVMPKFEPVFANQATKLPTATRWMMAASGVLTEHWVTCLLGLVATTGLMVYGLKTAAGRRARDWVKINAPIIGPLYRKVTISRSIRTLGTMVASGVSVLDAIELSSEVSGNSYYEAVWKSALGDVTSGSQIHEALASSPLFPSTLVQMIRAGEQTGKLDTVLSRVSSFYDNEVESAIKTTTSLIEPIMIAVMGVVVGGIGMAILLPIFSLSRMGH